MSIIPKTRKSAQQAGFSLVELVIVVSIIITLAGIVAPRLSSFGEKAKFAKAASELKAIKKAVELLYLDVGFYPAPVAIGVDPGLVDPSLVPGARRPDWRGPYLEGWPTEGPWGDAYEYQYRTGQNFNFDGLGGNEVFVALGGTMGSATATRLDEIMDDGNVNGGMLRFWNNRVHLFVGEGPRW